jgi:hypothetical protein
MVPEGEQLAKPKYAHNGPRPGGRHGAEDRGDEKPPWALAVAEIAPTGADRQGRGRS